MSLPDGSNSRCTQYGTRRTGRYVNNQLRLIFSCHGTGPDATDWSGDLVEWPLTVSPSISSPPTIVTTGTPTNHWKATNLWQKGVFTNGPDNFHSNAQWEDQGGNNGRMWLTVAVDYNPGGLG